MTDNDIDHKLKTLGEALAASRAAVQAGEDVDLKGLDTEVGKLCELIGGLDKQESARYVPALQDLVSTLDKLAIDLRQAFERPL